ncbi:hypothetical protein C2869_03480 [Saccharobesus litoralis]|uniref:TonB-dependent receptor n=1 Tax=Saccharobesus litoralis TaxID=2172099 RepID=A0A2S0VMV5_9ALTE|nr:TonB-dependent receptor [Saccharobesus litoralis]AWB65553.1 hypothetical protein C2869_03480 [Saccharobesus litoralis]
MPARQQTALNRAMRFKPSAIATAVAFCCGISAANAQEESQDEAKQDIEVIEVTGIKRSLSDAVMAKRAADQIMDAISSEDIGKLPDTNVAEALSRVTGVQIDRNDAGDGAGFQVRGISQNRVEVNGRSMVSNTDGSRSNSFSSTSSAMFKGIEVIKSPTADTVEGALGAVIRLKTFQPLDFKKDFTYAGNFQGVAQDNADKDEGIIASSLFATRFEVGEGDLGMLLNLSYEDRDISTVRWGNNWDVPQKRPNVQCSSGTSNDTLGVFDPSRDSILDTHPCPAVALGSIVGPDGSVASGQPYPLADYNYGLNSSGVFAPNHPLLDYSVIHPNNFVWERKPFNNEKTGVDFNIQWAPSENLSAYIQATYNKFSQLRPQTKIVIPAGGGGSNSRLQDGFVIQEFTRPSTGSEYRVTNQVTDYPIYEDNQISHYLEPVTGDITHGVLVAGRLSSDAVRFANNNQNKDETQRILAAGFEYFPNDNWKINAEVNYSSSETFQDELNLNMNFSEAPNSYWDLRDNRFDMPTAGLIGPDTTYDSATDTCYTNQQHEDSTDANPIYLGSIADASCGASLQDWTSFKFGGFNGLNKWFSGEETSATIDFDYEIDGDIIRSIEFGARFTSAEYSRSQVQVKRLDATNSNPNANLNVDPVIGDGNFDGVTGDGTDIYVNIEDLEPSFVLNGLASTPSFIDDYTASSVFPRSWLTQVFNDQYHLWFDRLNGHAFWRDNAGNFYRNEEKSQAFYFKTNFDSEIFGMPIKGNVGARYINYDFNINWNQLQTDDNGNIVKVNETVISLDGVPTEVELDSYLASTADRNVNKLLPSGNASLQITDDMMVRFAAAKVVSMPNPNDLVESAPVINDAATGLINHNTGNLNLDPYEANQYDLSYEWYISESAVFSAAYFRKDLKTFIVKASSIQEINDELLLNIKRPINTDGGSVNGLELSYRATFDFLPGWLSGFGTETGYTYTDSSQNSGVNELTGEEVPIENLSENSYNVIFFYDRSGFQFRAAYNYRDPNFKGIDNGFEDRSGLKSVTVLPSGELLEENYSVALGQFEEERGVLDLSMSYRFNKHVTVSLQGNNVTNEPIQRYRGVPGLTTSFLDPGASYRAAIRISFK